MHPTRVPYRYSIQLYSCRKAEIPAIRFRPVRVADPFVGMKSIRARGQRRESPMVR
jgi:hypothetical protein